MTNAIDWWASARGNEWLGCETIIEYKFAKQNSSADVSAGWLLRHGSAGLQTVPSRNLFAGRNDPARLVGLPASRIRLGGGTADIAVIFLHPGTPEKLLQLLQVTDQSIARPSFHQYRPNIDAVKWCDGAICGTVWHPPDHLPGIFDVGIDAHRSSPVIWATQSRFQSFQATVRRWRSSECPLFISIKAYIYKDALRI